MSPPRRHPLRRHGWRGGARQPARGAPPLRTQARRNGRCVHFGRRHRPGTGVRWSWQQPVSGRLHGTWWAQLRPLRHAESNPRDGSSDCRNCRPRGTGRPRTTFNVGIVEGGTSINSIAFRGSMQVDLRSVSALVLARLDSAFRRAVHQAVDAERRRWPQSSAGLVVEIVDMGRRPAGTQPDSLWLVRGARQAASALGFAAPAPGWAARMPTYRSVWASPPSRSTGAGPAAGRIRWQNGTKTARGATSGRSGTPDGVERRSGSLSGSSPSD